MVRHTKPLSDSSFPKFRIMKTMVVEVLSNGHERPGIGRLLQKFRIIWVCRNPGSSTNFWFAVDPVDRAAKGAMAGFSLSHIIPTPGAPKSSSVFCDGPASFGRRTLPSGTAGQIVSCEKEGLV